MASASLPIPVFPCVPSFGPDLPLLEPLRRRRESSDLPCLRANAGADVRLFQSVRQYRRRRARPTPCRSSGRPASELPSLPSRARAPPSCRCPRCRPNQAGPVSGESPAARRPEPSGSRRQHLVKAFRPRPVGSKCRVSKAPSRCSSSAPGLCFDTASASGSSFCGADILRTRSRLISSPAARVPPLRPAPRTVSCVPGRTLPRMAEPLCPCLAFTKLPPASPAARHPRSSAGNDGVARAPAVSLYRGSCSIRSAFGLGGVRPHAPARRGQSASESPRASAS